MTERKFYKQTVVIEILSTEALHWDSLESIENVITDGDCSGRWWIDRCEEMNGEQAAAALIKQGSDPSFFDLTEDGDDESEEPEDDDD